ncbi:hypothetical protein BDZ91DRAFT_847877 [Kalaharituber pfeilii]|nr:hypothetical protein BDZ91DRAFT_847877 [Kalaharituber pfeilii]
MRFSTILSLAVVAASTLVTAWSNEDHEIFRLREEVELYEGKGTTFYDFIGVKSSSASLDEINKAYRKTSLKLHPDKFQPVPPSSEPGKPPRKLTQHAINEQRRLAQERYARLSLIATILRGPQRDRYDHFLNNGFPRWKGTGYYYARYRPGLGSVLVGLFIFVGGFTHYGYLWLSARQKRKFFENFIHDARVSAWGSAGIPGLADVAGSNAVTSGTATPPTNGPSNRRERRMQKRGKSGNGDDEGESGASTPAPQVVGSAGPGRRKVVAPNGKVLIVNSSGDVFLVEEDEETGEEVEIKVDVNEIEQPTFKDTAMVRLPIWFFRTTLGRFLPQKKEQASELMEEDIASEEDAAGDASELPAKKVKKPLKAGAPQKIEKRDGLPRRKVRSK